MTSGGGVFARACSLLSQQYAVSYVAMFGTVKVPRLGRRFWVHLVPFGGTGREPGFAGIGVSGREADLHMLDKLRRHFVDLRIAAPIASPQRQAAAVLVAATEALIDELEQQGD